MWTFTSLLLRIIPDNEFLLWKMSAIANYYELLIFQLAAL